MIRLIKKDYFYVFLLFICSLALFALYLGHPDQLYWDELIHINGARTILYGNKPYAELTQTPLGREILVASLYVFGDTPFGARMLTALSSSLNIVVLFGLGRLLFKKTAFALLPPLFLLTDLLFYVQARIGMVDQFLTLFMLLSFYYFLKILDDTSALRSYFLVGFYFGLAVAIKSVAIALLPLYLFFITKNIFQKQISIRRGFCFYGALILPSPLIFWFSYGLLGFSFHEMLTHLNWLWGFLSNFQIDPSITSDWKDWLLVQKPIWYLFEELGGNSSKVVLAAGNPFFWLAAEFSFIALLFFGRSIPKKFFYLHAVIVFQFLFWSVKPSTHIYYMLPVLPFYALLIGALFWFLWDRFPNKRNIVIGNAIALWLLSLGFFIYYFPLIQGQVVSNQVLQRYPNLPP